ncbi:MAG: phosphoribosyltransferase, partial [Pseudomonadota bacterium]
GRVVVVDDVLSSGSSIAAVLDLLDLVAVTPTAIGAAMLQGEAWATRVRGIPVEGALRTPILPPVGEV